MTPITSQKQSLNPSTSRPLLTTKILKWTISITILSTVATVLVLVFPEYNQKDTVNKTQPTGTRLTAEDRLRGLNGPSPDMPKTVGYTGTITAVSSDALTIRLANDSDVVLQLLRSTVIERKLVSANPEPMKVTALTSGQSVQVVAETPENNPTLKMASKIIITN